MNELIVPDTGLQVKMNELIVPDTGLDAPLKSFSQPWFLVGGRFLGKNKGLHVPDSMVK